MPNTKIATCCYCGTRAALVLRGEERHELACSGCGAPLHDLKMLKSDHPGDRNLVRPSRGRPRAEPETKKHTQDRKRRKKKRKSFKERVAEEIWDVLEDIFD
ncbi:MAG: hypothetical protein AAFR35_03120 [Pseudomonadota bacterium]